MKLSGFLYHFITTGKGKNRNFASSETHSSHLTALHGNGVWSPLLHEFLVTGRPISQIIIKRLATLHSGFVELQATQYTDSYITTYEQRGDKIFFTFSFVKITDAQIVYDNTGRKVTGINAFEFDYTSTLSNTAPKELSFMEETEARGG